jgi:hypothetical protein
MTTEQLERDLRTLAEPREGDEHLRRAVRAHLDEHMPVRAKPRLRLRLGVGLAGAAAAAVALVVVSLGGPGGSTANAAIMRHALQAITPPADAIVHVKEIGTQVEAEWWQQTSPPYALRMIKGPIGNEVETVSSSAPALVDPIESVRDQLASGGAQVAGTETIDGMSYYKIELPTGVVAYFDTTSYMPVYLDNPQRGGSVVRTRVVTYEELPMTQDTAKLLGDAPQK